METRKFAAFKGRTAFLKKYKVKRKKIELATLCDRSLNAFWRVFLNTISNTIIIIILHGFVFVLLDWFKIQLSFLLIDPSYRSIGCAVQNSHGPVAVP